MPNVPQQILKKRGLLKRSRALTMEAEDRIGLFKTSLKSLPEYESIGLDPGDLAAEDVRPFPSIPDRMLKRLGLFGVFVEDNKNLNEPDIEEKYAQLSLAFKTDKFTLGKRLDLQLRQRDIAEKNIESELRALRESLNALNQLCTESDMREIITKTQQHVDIVQQATMRMSSRAETYGAIQQEQRMNCAFETMLNYVEHLKLLYDKEHLELEEYRRLLAEHNLLPREEGKAHHDDDPKRPSLPPRSHSLSSSSKPESRTRLLSAVCLLNNNFESSRGAALNSGQVSPKSRRSSLPVGPLAQSGRVTTHGSISERKDSPASKLSRESKLTRTESEESTSSKPESDSAPCPQLQEQPEEDATSAEPNDMK